MCNIRPQARQCCHLHLRPQARMRVRGSPGAGATGAGMTVAGQGAGTTGVGMTATNSPGVGGTGAAVRGARMTGAQAPGAQQRTANVVGAQRPFRQATRASRSTGRTSAFVSATHAALELHLARAQSSSMAASWTRAGGAPCPFTNCTTRGKGAILTRDGGAPCVTTEDVKQTSMRRAGCLASRGVPTLGWRALRLGAQAVTDTTWPR